METRVSSQGSGQGQAPEAKLRLLAVHAHPDDESSKGAATMAKYAREGVEVLVATMTGGERGSVLNPAMDRPEVVADLPRIRRAEMARAREALALRAGDKLLVVVRGKRVILLQKPGSHRTAIRGLASKSYPPQHLQQERRSWE